MKTFKKKLYILPVIVILLIFILLDLETQAETDKTPITIINSGNCGKYGDNVKWELNSNGVLTLYGEGKMQDYRGDSYDNATKYACTSPWAEGEYQELINKIVICEGITEIGSSAFYGHVNVTSVEIANTVSTFNSSCFAYCKSLSSILIPDKVTQIGGRAFLGCTELTNLTIPNNITIINDYLCKGCTNLTNVVFTGNVKSIGYGAFYNCMKLESIFIPNSITSIRDEAFGYYYGYGESKKIPTVKFYTYAGTCGESYARNNEFSYSNISIDVNLSECEYTGKEIKPIKDIKIDDTILKCNEDFTIEYFNNIEIGTATAIITFIDDLNFIKCNFVSNFKVIVFLNKCELKLDRDNYQYHMSLPRETITYNGKILGYTHYDIKYTIGGKTDRDVPYEEGCWEVGTCYIDIIGKDSVIGNIKKEIQISKRDISNMGIPVDMMKDFVTYNGSEQKQNEKKFKIYDECGLIPSSEYDISYLNNINVGTATMIVKGKGNYTGSIKSWFYITPYSIENDFDIKLDKSKYQYTGYEINPKVLTVKDKYGNILVKDVDYGIGYKEENINPGTASIEIYGIGNYSGSQRKNFTITPKKVKGLKVKEQSTNHIKLSWTIDGPVSGFEVYSYNYKKKKWEYVGKTSKTSYTIKNLKPKTTYKYKVRAYVGKIDGKQYSSEYSSSIKVITKPQKVNDFKVKKQTTKSINLSWSKVLNTTGYKVYSYNYKKKKWEFVGKTSKTSYTIKKLKAGTTYKYRVRAYKTVDGTQYYGSYTSSLKTTTKTKTPSISKLSTKSKKATIKWKKISGASGYQIYMSTSKKGNYSKIKTITKGSTTSYTKAKLKKNKKYYFKIRTYRTINGKKVYSSYSSVKSIKIK